MAKDRPAIAFYPFNEKKHSLYKPVIDLLGKNYRLIYNPKDIDKNNLFAKLARDRILKYIYHMFLAKFLSLNEIKSLFKKSENLSEKVKCDLVWASNNIPDGKCDYILDLEIVSALSGYNYRLFNREKIKDELEKKRCKAIICWNQASKDSLINCVDCSNFLEKIKVIPFSIKSMRINKVKNDKIDFLFVSSINNPYDFEQKGGIIALQIYERIRLKYNNVCLNIRANVPKWIKDKYVKFKDINFIENKLSDDEMEKLFLKTDLLLVPVPGINLLLECMQYEIPVVCFDFWLLPEMVINGKNGYTLDSNYIFGDKNQEYYYFDHSRKYLKLFDRQENIKIINHFVQKYFEIIDKPGQLNKMAKFSKKMIGKNGKYSLERINKELLRVVKKSLGK